ncbi:VanZ family protein [bacterium]|nr:VanZ family protein [bacterium]
MICIYSLFNRLTIFELTKSVHIAEYSILGALMARSIFSLNLRYSERPLFIVAISLSTLWGLFDEVQESFTPGTHALEILWLMDYELLCRHDNKSPYIV